MHTPFVAGFLSGLTLIVAIGAQNSFVLRQGIRREHRLPITLICALSDAALIIAGIAGLGALIQASPGLLTLTRLGGAGFLLTYGFLAARRAWRGGQQCSADNASTTLVAAVTACLGFTFLNPHVYLDTVVLLGALANQQGEAGRWVFGGGAASASVFWFVSLAYGAGRLAPVFRNPAAWRLLDSLIALIVIGLAVELLRGLGS